MEYYKDLNLHYQEKYITGIKNEYIFFMGKLEKRLKEI